LEDLACLQTLEAQHPSTHPVNTTGGIIVTEKSRKGSQSTACIFKLNLQLFMVPSLLVLRKSEALWYLIQHPV
jgi:hypothetical protein